MTEQPTDAPELRIWQASPCPPWCAERHHDADAVDARDHMTQYDVIPLTTEDGIITKMTHDGITEVDLDALHVALEQGYREVAPRVIMSRTDGATTSLTLEEAARLSEQLQRLVNLGLA